MQVTIIFEDLNLFSLQSSVPSKKTITKILKLRITKRLLIFALLCVMGILCVLFNLPIFGVSLIIVSSLLFYVLEYFKYAYDVEIKFTEADQLDKIIKEDLFD
jgi:hypothetical protein